MTSGFHWYIFIFQHNSIMYPVLVWLKIPLLEVRLLHFTNIYKQIFLFLFIVKLAASTFRIASESILHSCCIHINPWHARLMCVIIIVDARSEHLTLCPAFWHTALSISVTSSFGGEFDGGNVFHPQRPIQTVNFCRDLVSSFIAYERMPWIAPDWPLYCMVYVVPTTIKYSAWLMWKLKAREHFLLNTLHISYLYVVVLSLILFVRYKYTSFSYHLFLG